MISILCAMEKSNYYSIPKLDIWSKERDAYFFTGSNPVITHAPCQQWSRLKSFAHPNASEKELAFHCLKIVIRNGGIFEHPAGSSFFKEAGCSSAAIISVDQSWFGFPCRKRTYLFLSRCKLNSFPIRFDLPLKRVPDLTQELRSKQPLSFCKWLVESVNNSIK